MKKRLLSMLLVVCMVATMLPVTVFAADYQVNDTYSGIAKPAAPTGTEWVVVENNVLVCGSDSDHEHSSVTAWRDSCWTLATCLHTLTSLAGSMGSAAESIIGSDIPEEMHDPDCYGGAQLVECTIERNPAHYVDGKHLGSEVVHSNGNCISGSAYNKLKNALVEYNMTVPDWLTDAVSATSAKPGVYYCYDGIFKCEHTLFSHNDACYNLTCTKHEHSDACYGTTWKLQYLTYTVTWKNDNGAVLETDENVQYSTVPTYDGETPVAQNTEEGKTYTFTGWTPKVEAVEGNVTYTAVYEETVNKYTVTWKNDDGTVLETDENVPYGTVPTYDGETPVAQNTEEGKTYTFTGWTPAVDVVKKATTYTATYSNADTIYTVTFNTNGGTTVADASVGHGETITANTTTTREGYRFNCWTLDGKEFDLSTPITGNITLVAAWVEQVTVTFNTDGGTTVAAQTGDIGMTATEPSTTKDGYVFDGWYLNGTKYAFDAEVNESITLTAKWLEQYTVDFNANGGEGSMDAQTFTEGQEQALTANAFTKSGYTFKGWAESADGEVKYTDGQEITATGKITLYAVWEKNPLIATTIEVTNATVEVTYGDFTSSDLLAQIAPVVKANGKELSGAVVTIEDITDEDAGTHTVTLSYAEDGKHAASTATVQVIINKAPANVVVASQTVKYGEKVANPFKVNCDTIDVVAGMDLNDETYLLGSVQIQLPDSLSGLLDTAKKAGMNVDNLSIDQLKKVIGLAKLMGNEQINNLVGNLETYSDTIEQLIDVLLKIQAELPVDSELKISLVKQLTLPTDVGVYLAASIACDKNYEAVEANDGLDAGYLIITPNGIKAEMEWKDTDDNDILTLNKASTFELGATATVIPGTAEGADYSDAEANEHIEYIFIGVDADGNLLLNRCTDASEMTNAPVGLYAQVAYVANWDNVMYYAEPIARPIIIVPNVAKVAIVDGNGNENYAQVYTYGDEIKLTVTVDGTPAPVEGLTVKYIGSDTTVDGWYRDELPTDAGVYTVVAVYTEKENDQLVKAGGAVGVLVIEPADTEVGLEDAKYRYDGKEHFATITNKDLDYATVAIDRKNNIAYVNLPDDTAAHADRIVGVLPAELEAEVRALLSKYSTFDGDVSSDTLKTELTAIIEKVIAADLTAEAKELTKQLVEKLAADLEGNEDITALVEKFKSELAALEQTIRDEIPDDMESTLEDYIGNVVTENNGSVEVDVTKVKDDITAKIKELESKLPEAVVAELYEMVDELTAAIENNEDVQALESKATQILNKLKSLEMTDAETVVKAVIGAIYSQVDMDQLKAVLTEAAAKVEARGYVEYLENMAKAISGMYEGKIDTSALETAIEDLSTAIENKIQNGNFEENDLEDLETYVDKILAAMLTVVEQIPDCTFVFGKNPKDVGEYDCYAMNISANYKWEFVEADLVIYKEETDRPDYSGSSKPVLNKKEHFAFLSGYPDDTFRPDNNMTRAEVAAMFYNLVENKTNRVFDASFSDVAEDIWYAEAIGYMERYGIMSGYPDGTFRPNAPITRAEFAAVATAFDNLTKGDCTFSDVSESDWYYTFVSFAAEKGWVSGYPDGTFRPAKYITRAEVTAVTCKLLERMADDEYVRKHEDELVRTFIDLPDEDAHWAYWFIVEATNGHDYVKVKNEESWKDINK